jgi:hypothetical protein
VGRVRCCGSLTVGLIGAFLLSDPTIACDAEKIKTTDGGFIFRVVGGSNKIEARKEPGSEETAFTLELLAPYFVVCEEDKFYKITDVWADTAARAEGGKVGYVLKEHVHPWPTRAALGFSPVAFTGDRPEIVAWDDESILKKFLDTGNQKLAPPAFREDLESTLKRERATRPYPVLGSSMQMLRNTVEKRVFDVLIPAAVPPETKVVDATENKLDKVMTGANIVIAFDATDSMAPFAAQFAADLRVAFEALPTDIQMVSTVGIVFFRDEGDAEKYAIVPPTSVADAMKVLTEAATPTYMQGGSGRSVPVLDAVYIAHHLFPWANPQGGRRIIVVVLGHDARVVTMGKIHDSVPPALEPDQLAADLRDDGIQVVTVQAGPASGKFLIPILTTLAETTKGVFVEWGSGGDERRERVVAAVARQLSERAETIFKEGKKDLASLEFDYRGYSTIPLKVLDGEKLQGLRTSGVPFNVDPSTGGVLVREGFILDNSELLELQIQVDKKMLETLIDLFSFLGVSGADNAAMRESAAQALTAIAGEGYDGNEAVDMFIKRRLGIQFRPKFLDFEYIAGMNRSERLEMAKRIQNAGLLLSQFLEDNLEALEKNQVVWMPVALLP